MHKVFHHAILIASLFLFFNAGAQTSTTGSFNFDGINRTYRLYIPANYNPTNPTPLIINMHGYGSNNLEQELYTNFLPIADTAGFIITHPNGTLDVNNQLHWNTFGTSNVNDVGFISALIDTLSSQLNIDLSRVYATGMSNGGFMSFQLACKLSQRIAAIASVTGTMTNANLVACQPAKPVPVMQIHGTADATVPYNGNFFFASVPNILNFWIAFNGTTNIPEIYPLPDINPTDGCTAERHTYSGGTNGSQVIHYKILGGGHSWPGAPININITNMDFSASAEIWRFFKRYNLNGLAVGTTATQKPEPSDMRISQQGDNIALIFPDARSRNIWLFDASGRLLERLTIWSATHHLPLSKKGLYFITTSDGLRSKFVVR